MLERGLSRKSQCDATNLLFSMKLWYSMQLNMKLFHHDIPKAGLLELAESVRQQNATPIPLQLWQPHIFCPTHLTSIRL